MSMMYLPTSPVELAMPLGNRRALGIEHDARGFAATGGQHHDARVDGDFLARLLVDVGDAGGLAVGADHHFAAHGAGADFQVAGRQRGRDVHAGRGEVGVDRAGAAALGAIVAGGAAVERLGQNREARRDAGNLELVADPLDDALVGARRGRGLEASVGRIFQAFLRAEDADQFLGLVVVGRKVVVGDGPVEALAVAAVGLEIVGAHAQRDAAVVIGAAAQHARAVPHELAAGRGGVGLAGDLPAADQGGVVVAEGLLLGAGGAMRSVVVPLEHVALLGGVVIAAGFQHADLGAGQREHVGGDAAAGSGANDDHVVRFRTGFDLRQWNPPRTNSTILQGRKRKRGGLAGLCFACEPSDSQASRAGGWQLAARPM